MKNTKKMSLVILVALAMLLTACGASNGSAMDYTDSIAGDKNFEVAPEIDKEGNNTALDNRKIVKTVTLYAETKAFDEAVSHIRNSVTSLNGYIESSDITGSSISYQSNVISRTATFKLRIPVDKLEEYVESVEGRVNIVSQKENIDDITDQYFDVDARLNSLKIERERLEAMLKESKDLEYLITLNDRLADVNYEIETYTSTIRRYDNMVSYSTVNITLEEVIDYTEMTTTPQSFGERFVVACSESWNNFVDGLEDFTIDLIYAAPGIAVFILVLLIVAFLILLAAAILIFVILLVIKFIIKKVISWLL